MDKQSLIDAIEDQIERTRDIRKEERKYKSMRNGLVNSPIEFKAKISSLISQKLVPQNIGKLSQVLWPQSYDFSFDFTDPNNANNILIPANGIGLQKREQVTQEACFLVTSIHRDAFSAGNAGIYAPLGVTIRDNSSTRTLNDYAIPFTAIGLRTRPTKLPIPFLVQPNASINMELKSLWHQDISVPNERGIIKIIMSGYRVRPDDVNTVIRELYF